MAYHSTTDDSTKTFRSTSSPHRPDNVYNPQPFPLSPTEGNPWQAARPYTPPAPGSMRMPEPVVNGVPVRTHGSVWGSEGSHTNAWDTSGESGDISSQNSQGGEYRHEYTMQPTVWRSEVRQQNAWDDPYPTGESTEAPVEEPVEAPVEAPAKSPFGKALAKASGKTPAKVPVKSSTKHSPYRFAGTKYATSEGEGEGEGEGEENEEAGVAGGKVPSAKKSTNSRNARENDHTPYMGGPKQLPSSKRVWLRVFQLIAAVGRFGFQAGAGPFSGRPIPPDFDLASFYLLYVVAWITIILSIFHFVIYLRRRFGRGEKVKRFIIILADLIMAVLWGAGVVSEIIKNRCPPGSYDHWCDFYNIAIFWGSFELVLFVLAVAWDVVGSCSNKRQREIV